jgi:hypothetical protein
MLAEKAIWLVMFSKENDSRFLLQPEYSEDEKNSRSDKRMQDNHCATFSIMSYFVLLSLKFGDISAGIISN